MENENSSFSASSVVDFDKDDLSRLLEEFDSGVVSSVEGTDQLVNAWINAMPKDPISPISSSPPITGVIDTFNVTKFQKLEKKQSIAADYIEKQSEVTPSMRAVLLDWMLHVHMHLGIETASFYMAVAILDAYLAAVTDTALTKFQLVGIAALRLATKSIESNVPKIEEHLLITGDKFTTKLIQEMEKKLISTVGSKLPRPLSFQFLRYLLREMHVDKQAELLSMHFLQLATFDAEIGVHKPSELAASSFLIAIHLQKAKFDVEAKDMDLTVELVKLAGYPMEHLQSIAHKITLVALKEPHDNLEAVIKKYSKTNDNDE